MTTPHNFSDSDEDEKIEEEVVFFEDEHQEEMVKKSDHDFTVSDLVLKFDNAAVDHEKQIHQLKSLHEANIKSLQTTHLEELTKSQLRINVLIDKFINDQ